MIKKTILDEQFKCTQLLHILTILKISSALFLKGEKKDLARKMLLRSKKMIFLLIKESEKKSQKVHRHL